MRTHESQSQQEPVANEDLDIDNIINANIGGSGARHGNDLSLRSRLGEDRVFLYPFLFRLDFGLWELAWCPGALRVPAIHVDLMEISYAGHYHSCICMINGFL